MKFAQFHAGQVIEAGPVGVSEADIVDFAQRYDPQWFHTDVERANASRWQGVIASGWHTCALAMRLAVEGPLAQSESFGSPGLAYLRWLHPVRAGDQLRLRATVIETRRSDSRPGLGILRWRWQMFTQEGTEVLDLEATSLFDLSAADVDGAR
jgi:acyl dehydratase